ncbi:MAG: hypothetical protein AB1846_19045 [Chloroflexota bacterium]
MLTPPDLLRLPYTPDLTEGGIAYAVRSLPYTYDRMSGSLYSRLRRIVGGVAVELAFRRYLGGQDVPFDVKGATPFTEPDRYDVALGGHRCDIKTFIISRRKQITEVRRRPGLLLRAPALIPSDQFASESHLDGDLYIFAFLLGLTTNSQEDIQAARQAGQPLYLIHPFEKDWSRPQAWASMGPLALKSECAEAVTVELGGQDSERQFITRSLCLPPLERLSLPPDFYSLSCIHVDRPPEARIGIHSPNRGETRVVSPHEWGNIWVYGMDIYLTGYLSHDEFRRRADPIASGSRVFQYSKTQTKNQSVPVADLRPLPELLERVREWAASASHQTG